MGLVKPDLRTDNNANVDLPPALVAKWKKEGRYEKEVNELDAFFKRTGWPRAPRYYLMKWIEDKKTVNPKALNNWSVIPTDWWENGKEKDAQLLFKGTISH